MRMHDIRRIASIEFRPELKVGHRAVALAAAIGLGTGLDLPPLTFSPAGKRDVFRLLRYMQARNDHAGNIAQGRRAFI